MKNYRAFESCRFTVQFQLTASWNTFQSTLASLPLLGTYGLAVGNDWGPSGSGDTLDDSSSSTERVLDISLLLAEIKLVRKWKCCSKMKNGSFKMLHYTSVKKEYGMPSCNIL